MKANNKKLGVQKETLRQLGTADLQNAGGGSYLIKNYAVAAYAFNVGGYAAAGWVGPRPSGPGPGGSG